jgi:hypothetical protein
MDADLPSLLRQQRVAFSQPVGYHPSQVKCKGRPPRTPPSAADR